MLDVMHFLFEEDLQASSEEEAKAKTQVRSVLYKDLYNQTYKYGVRDAGQSYNYSDNNYPSDGFAGKNDSIPDPIKPPTKAYVPTTDFNVDSPLPFGKIVDPPLGN